MQLCLNKLYYQMICKNNYYKNHDLNAVNSFIEAGSISYVSSLFIYF